MYRKCICAVIISAVLVFSVFPTASFADAIEDHPFLDVRLSESDIKVICEAIEETAPDSSFAVRISLACVILNRYRSPLYPDSILRIVECASFLSYTPGKEVSHKTETAVRYALFGASPCASALYAEKTEDGSIPESASSGIVIENWAFFSR